MAELAPAPRELVGGATHASRASRWSTLDAASSTSVLPRVVDLLEPEEAQGGRVRLEPSPLRVLQLDGIARRRVDERPQPVVALAQRALEALSLGDLDRDPRHTPDAPAGISEGLDARLVVAPGSPDSSKPTTQPSRAFWWAAMDA